MRVRVAPNCLADVASDGRYRKSTRPVTWGSGIEKLRPCALDFASPGAAGRDMLIILRREQELMPRPPLIEIDNATVWRGGTRVFHRLSLSIGQGENVAILGPNGSGKTTLLKLINRELYPVVQENSVVRVMGRRQWNVWDLRGQIGWVSSDLQADFLSGVTVQEAIASGYFQSMGVDSRRLASLSEAQKFRVSELAKALDLEGLAMRNYGTLSTGQQRRALLARALIHEPGTLILDEPTVGLDMAASFNFLSRLQRLASQGCSIVMVTHHLNEIPPEIERVIILKHGRVALDGEKSKVLTGEILSEIYEMSIDVVEVKGQFLAHQP